MEEGPALNGYRIRDSQIPIVLSLKRTSSLKPHEETVPSDLEKLVKTLREDPILRHPIIVDGETGLVLDGTHRTAALSLLMCQLIPCALVNYKDPKIKVEKWFRTISGSSLNDFKSSLFGRTIEVAERSSAEKCLSSRKCYASLEDTKSCLVLSNSNSTPVELARKAFELENLAREGNMKVTYSDNKTLPVTDKGFVLSTIRLEKEEVVDSCFTKVLFPPKTTRHVIPSRPLGISVPLDWLKTESLYETQTRFRNHLASKRVKHLPEGSKIGSRLYQEEVFVFE